MVKVRFGSKQSLHRDDDRAMPLHMAYSDIPNSVCQKSAIDSAMLRTLYYGSGGSVIMT